MTTSSRPPAGRIRRVKADSGEALLKAVAALEEDGAPRILQRNGRDVAAIVRVNQLEGVVPKRPTKEEIEYAFGAAGSWADLDGEALKRQVYRNRRSGTRPASRRRRLL